MRTVLCAEGPVEPHAAIERYLSEFPPAESDPVHLLFGTRRTPPPLPPRPWHSLTVGSFLPGRGLRDVADLTYHRQSYSQICRALIDGSLQPDAVIACSTARRADGRYSLGAVNGYLDLALIMADQVFLEEVSWLPHVPGAAQADMPADVMASTARAGDPQPSLSGPFDEADLLVAKNVAGLLPSQPRLALGIGKISDALCQVLNARQDIDLITGVVTSGLRSLHESGAPNRAPIRAMSVVGTAELLDWCATSGAVELLPSTQLHDAAWLAGHDRFVAVLGAVQVDAEGNVNAEAVGGRRVSGRGGAPDFAAGAHRSEGGATIIALRSTDAQGSSRLVGALEDPSVAACDVDAVATERGAVWLGGLDADARGHALRRIF